MVSTEQPLGRSLPRLVIAAPASGHGKTTIATGIMAALTTRGVSVAPFKVGPDYIDPGYHTLACGRPGRNLDPVLCGEELMAPLLVHGAQGADVAVIEGVMGLFDGRLGSRGEASTAHVASLLDAPVLLVVDARHTSRSVGALVLGMARFDPAVRVAGVVVNQIGSERHAAEVRSAVEEVGLPVLGMVPRNLDITTPSRHLGLVPAAERDDAGIAAMGSAIAEHVDLDAVLALAATAPVLDAAPWDPAAVVHPPSEARPRVAVAGGRAFTFRYPETDELLRAAGCEPVVFDPTSDEALPEVDGLWLGGGFPEVHAAELTGNASLRAQVRELVLSGLPTVAECAGLLYLCDSIDGAEMVGALHAEAAMDPRLTMGYRRATSPGNSLLGRPDEVVTGHEFHRTRVTFPADEAAWLLDGRPDGVASTTVHASYLHVHWAGHPHLAQRFADAVHAHAAARVDGGVPREYQPAAHSAADSESPGEYQHAAHSAACSEPPGNDSPDPLVTPPDAGPDLWHHGDRDLAPGLVDFAVNVRRARTPAWLMAELTTDTDWAAYPDASAARAAIAHHHGVPENMVLPTAGAAEAFTLIARIATGTSLVVHPQFTEPEAALLAAGHQPRRHLLRAADDFALRPDRVPPADLVIVGNPTNPTAVLHPADSLLALDAGTLVVDEAFLDAIPGEPHTLIAPEMPGRLVLRSLTKTWALAGLRAGYVVGDPTLIAALAAQQPPWSVSTPAAQAMAACLRPESVREADELARASVPHRADLVTRLQAIGLHTVPGAAPFVLVDTRPLAPTSLREPLADLGFAVRRGETFPGLGPTWLRLAVRDPDQHAALVSALTTLKEHA